LAGINVQFTPAPSNLTDLSRGVLMSPSPTRKETSYSDRRFLFSYVLFIITVGGILVLSLSLYIYIYRERERDAMVIVKKRTKTKIAPKKLQHLKWKEEEKRNTM
jgi:hypothetical protein